MNGDMDPNKWTKLEWAEFLFKVLAPTIVVVLYILARMGLL